MAGYRPKLGNSRNIAFPLQFQDTIDIISLATTPVQYFDMTGRIIDGRTASGFFYRAGSKIYFCSARHAITGLDAFSDAPISPDGYLPHKIQVRPCVRNPKESYRLKEPLVLTVRDPEGAPRWREDPHFADLRVDIAAVEIEHADKAMFVCLNDHQDEPSLAGNVGFDCFVVGYPNPNFHDPYLPIWRRGSLAYETLFPVDDKPIFLVDASTSSGMSGSPIIQRWHGPAPLRQANGTINVKLDSVVTSRFIGVYGGRLSHTLELGQVGYGWYANRMPLIAVP